jgi:hypothetical protein
MCPISFQAVSDDCRSFRLSTGCHRRCSLFQPVLAGCYHDVITDLLPDETLTRATVSTPIKTPNSNFAPRKNTPHAWAGRRRNPPGRYLRRSSEPSGAQRLMADAAARKFELLLVLEVGPFWPLPGGLPEQYPGTGTASGPVLSPLPRGSIPTPRIPPRDFCFTSSAQLRNSRDPLSAKEPSPDSSGTGTITQPGKWARLCTADPGRICHRTASS